MCNVELYRRDLGIYNNGKSPGDSNLYSDGHSKVRGENDQNIFLVEKRGKVFVVGTVVQPGILENQLGIRAPVPECLMLRIG